MASSATSTVVSDRPAKMPPVWNQRTPAENTASQSTSPLRSRETAVCARSLTPSAPRTPKPRSTKLRPLRAVPSAGTQRISEVSTPP